MDVEALLEKLTVEEKVALTAGKSTPSENQITHTSIGLPLTSPQATAGGTQQPSPASA